MSKIPKMNRQFLKALLFGLFFFSIACFSEDQPTHPGRAHYVVLYVWDGLRPDSVTPQNTPNLYQLLQQGSHFIDNHSSYPTFTMMNAASFATGDRAGKTSFFGNTLWHPGLHGVDSANNPVDFNQPVFTEDYKILQDLNTDELFFVNTLFNSAHAKHFTTAAVGKSGPAFMQDYLSLGYTLDEKHIYPLTFAKQLQNDGYPLPKLSPNDFKPGELVLSPNNGAPTDAGKYYYLADGVTPDATDHNGSPFSEPNEYMMKMYLNEVVTKQMPILSVVWMRNPDTTEHLYGPGTANYFQALQSNDTMLGALIQTLKDRNLYSQTDIIVVSDHAHSTVSGPLNEFPLREINNGQVGAIDAKGYSVSGEIRTADILTHAGFHAFDGVGCVNDPVLSGIKKDNTPLHPVQIDTTGTICGTVNAKYVTPAYKVPQNLPQDAVVVAANGGTDYLYVPSHDKKLVKNLVTFLASHKQYDAIFVDSVRYGKVAGTIPLETIGIENPQGRSPDIVVGLSYSATAKVNGLPGTEFSDNVNYRGMHGSFSPVDVHNFLIASGPDFRAQYTDTYPTGNVDVAPTIAYLLGLELPNTDGRILFEALKESKQKTYNTFKLPIASPKPLQHLKIFNALNEPVKQTTFNTVVYADILQTEQGKYYYFDRAEGVRK